MRILSNKRTDSTGWGEKGTLMESTLEKCGQEENPKNKNKKIKNKNKDPLWVAGGGKNQDPWLVDRIRHHVSLPCTAVQHRVELTGHLSGVFLISLSVWPLCCWLLDLLSKIMVSFYISFWFCLLSSHHLFSGPSMAPYPSGQVIGRTIRIQQQLFTDRTGADMWGLWK